MKNNLFCLFKQILTGVLLCALLLTLFFPAQAMTSFYTFSAVYQTSEFYQRFCDVKQTGDQRYDVLSIAFSQLGYHGGNNADEFDGTNLTGTENFTEYSHWYFGRNGDINGYAWCAVFVSWCLRQARVSTAVCSNFSGCTTAVTMLKKDGKYQSKESGYIPKPGDIIFFCDLWEVNCSTHVGFVVGVEDNYVYTIEGNADKSVIQRRYDLQDPYVIGYGTLNYKEKSGTVYDFPLRYTLSGKGEYEVPSGGLILYTEPSCESSSAVVFSAGIRFETAYTAFGYGRVYLNESSSAVKVMRTVKKEYKGYKDQLDEAVTSSAVWFVLSEAIYLEKQPTKYTLKYDYQGGTVENPVAVQTIPAGSSVILSSAIPTKEGNTFLGWGYTVKDSRGLIQNGDVFTANIDRTVYAVWLPDRLSVSFYDADGKTLLSKTTVDYGSAVTSPITPTVIVSGGVEYEFDGWSPALSQNLKSAAAYTATYKVYVPPIESSAIDSSAINSSATDSSAIGSSGTDSSAISSGATDSSAISTGTDDSTTAPQDTVSPETTVAPGTAAPQTEASESDSGKDYMKLVIPIGIILAVFFCILCLLLILNRKKKEE